MTSQFAFLVLLSLTCASCVPSSFTSTIIPDSAPETAASSSPGIHSPTSEAFPTFNPFTNLGTVIIQRSPIQSLEITNITPSLTAATAETEHFNWIDEYFLKEIPKGAIDLGKIPLKAWRGLEISGPGIAAYQLSDCKIHENIKQLQEKKMYLSSLDMDFNRPEGDLRYCVIGMSTEESLGRWTKEIFPSQTPEEQKKLVEKEIRMFTALMYEIQSMDNRFVDAYMGIVPGPIKNNTDVAIFFYGNHSPSTGEYPIAEILDLQGSQLVPLQH